MHAVNVTDARTAGMMMRQIVIPWPSAAR